MYACTSFSSLNNMSTWTTLLKWLYRPIRPINFRFWIISYLVQTFLNRYISSTPFRTGRSVRIEQPFINRCLSFKFDNKSNYITSTKPALIASCYQHVLSWNGSCYNRIYCNNTLGRIAITTNDNSWLINWQKYMKRKGLR